MVGSNSWPFLSCAAVSSDASKSATSSAEAPAAALMLDFCTKLQRPRQVDPRKAYEDMAGKYHVTMPYQYRRSKTKMRRSLSPEMVR
jgi:hypothetical protein